MAAKKISVKTYAVRLSGEERQQLATLILEGEEPSKTPAEGADLVEGRCVGGR